MNIYICKILGKQKSTKIDIYFYLCRDKNSDVYLSHDLVDAQLYKDSSYLINDKKILSEIFRIAARRNKDITIDLNTIKVVQLIEKEEKEATKCSPQESLKDSLYLL